MRYSTRFAISLESKTTSWELYSTRSIWRPWDVMMPWAHAITMAMAARSHIEQLVDPLRISERQLIGNERWFLVHTLSRSERRAEWHLGAQGFRTYVPQIQKTVRH